MYLTPSELRTLAPAAAKLPKSDEALVDTGAFIRHVERQGFRPVFAAQGSPHADADAPLKSRHLAVLAKPDGFTLAILNSHTVWRRAWMGAGFSLGARFFILGAAVPLPRWRGFEAPLAQLLEYQAGLEAAKMALERWHPTIHQARWLTRKFASTAYLKGHRRPVATGLYSGADFRNAWGGLLTMLSRVREGGLPPEPIDSFIPPRKLKPIIAPDALMHAANAAFIVGLDGLRKYKIADVDFEFPKLRAS